MSDKAIKIAPEEDVSEANALEALRRSEDVRLRRAAEKIRAVLQEERVAVEALQEMIWPGVAAARWRLIAQ